MRGLSFILARVVKGKQVRRSREKRHFGVLKDGLMKMQESKGPEF